MGQTRRPAPATAYGDRARFALYSACSFEVGPGLERFATLQGLARHAAMFARFADHAIALQWVRGQWVEL